MKEKDKITIIVPIYNVEKYVAKCLDSLLEQTYSNIIIYAVIDGSPDRSVDIVRKYAEKDKRIVCIEKENGGYGSVLEYSIKKIKTEYFMICDPDDWLEKNAVETLYKIAKQNNLDIVVGDKFLIYEDEKKKEYCSSNASHKIVKENSVLVDQELYMMSLLSVSPHSKLYRTSLAKNVLFPHKISYTDFYLYIVVLSNSKRGMYLTKALSNYLIERVGNTATDKSKRAILNHIKVFNYTFEYLKCKENVSIYLYIKLYEQYRCSCLELVSKLKDSEIADLSDDLCCIDLLKDKKNEIKKNIKYSSIFKTIKNKIICSIVFNDKSRNILINLKRRFKYKIK